MRELTRLPWVVYAKRPFAGPDPVLRYVGRYTHRAALSPRRLLRLDPDSGLRCPYCGASALVLVAVVPRPARRHPPFDDTS